MQPACCHAVGSFPSRSCIIGEHIRQLYNHMCTGVLLLQSSALLLGLHQAQQHPYLNGSLHVLDENLCLCVWLQLLMGPS